MGAPGSLPRIAAGILEGFVAQQLETMLRPAWMPDASLGQRMAAAVKQITVSADRLVLQLDREAIDAGQIKPRGELRTSDADGLEVGIDFHTKRRQGELILSEPGGERGPRKRIDRALVRAIVLARS